MKIAALIHCHLTNMYPFLECPRVCKPHFTNIWGTQRGSHSAAFVLCRFTSLCHGKYMRAATRHRQVCVRPDGWGRHRMASRAAGVAPWFTGCVWWHKVWFPWLGGPSPSPECVAGDPWDVRSDVIGVPCTWKFAVKMNSASSLHVCVCRSRTTVI